MEAKGLTRFLDAQNQMYLKALDELRAGKKQSHWMWFVFPQLKGLGRSDTSRFYSISDIEEATDYLAHPVLGKHLIETAQALLQIQGKTATEILGSPDDLKLRSSMTLFSSVADAPPVFDQVLHKYFNGLPDTRTLEMLQNMSVSST